MRACPDVARKKSCLTLRNRFRFQFPVPNSLNSPVTRFFYHSRVPFVAYCYYTTEQCVHVSTPNIITFVIQFFNVPNLTRLCNDSIDVEVHHVTPFTIFERFICVSVIRFLLIIVLYTFSTWNYLDSYFPVRRVESIELLVCTLKTN